MNRLPLELHRLYVPQAAGSLDADADETSLIDGHGRVRAMVLQLARPADWGAISKVWNGVQADLDLPAPAIAVSGTDAYQLWFSLLEPLPAPRAMVFLEALRVRYLGDAKVERVSLMPLAAASSMPPSMAPVRHARMVPAAQEISGHWSAFVAPDLAPMFAEEPWLDMPPNDDGQARLLSRLQSIQPADFQRALERLGAAGPPLHLPQSQLPQTAAVASQSDGADVPLPPTRARRAARDFLLGVMNDEAVALGLRIEAAKALLHNDGDFGHG